VLRYLGRYTHRVAISNHRLLAFDGEQVSFRWRDYAHDSVQKIMKLAAIEFLRRFFLHVLPRGFCPHPALWLSRQSLSYSSVGRMSKAASRLTASGDNRSQTECNLALSSMRRTYGTTTGIYGSSPSSAVPCPRLFVTLQHIADHSMCSRHTCALVCLHAALIRQIGIGTAPIEPSLQRKLVAFSSASSLSAKAQSDFQRALNVLSP
jgi:hypothetical protein